MKKILSVCLLLALVCAYAIAVGETEVYDFACAQFAAVLPQGMRVPEEEYWIGLAAGAAADTGLMQNEGVLFACDEHNTRAMSVYVFSTEDTAEQVAMEVGAQLTNALPTASISFIVDLPVNVYDAAIYTVTLENTVYTQAVLCSGKTCMIVTSLGMEIATVQDFLNTVAFN